MKKIKFDKELVDILSKEFVQFLKMREMIDMQARFPGRPDLAGVA